MEYLAAYTRFFRHPDWKSNFGLGALMCLIPLVGTVLIVGWSVEVVQASHHNRDHHAPEVTFDRFVEYLKQGIWPTLLAVLASIPIFAIFVLAIVGVIVAWTSLPTGWAVAITIVAVLSYFPAVVGMQTLLTPLRLRVTLSQDLSTAMAGRWALGFYRRVWRELIAAALLHMALGLVIFLPLLVTGMLGVALTVPTALFGQARIEADLYRLYLERGGEPVSVKWVVVTIDESAS